MESILGSPINIVEKITYPNEGGMRVQLQRIELPKTATLQAIESATIAVKQSLVGLPIKELEQRLAVLMSLLIKPAQENVDDLSIRIRSLATELANHPADIVVRAIDEIKKSNKWWPTYSEFYNLIEYREEKRKLLLSTLALHNCNYAVE